MYRRTCLLEQLLTSSDFNSTPEWDAHLLANPTTPQAQAITWLSELDEYASRTSTLSRQELEERYALMVFYYATSGPSSSYVFYSSYYPNRATSVCMWNILGGNAEPGYEDGVYCDYNGFVNKFIMDGYYMEGEIPSEISLLQNLEHLSLARNLIGGFLPTQFRELSKLQILDLSHNVLSGPLSSLPLPRSIRKLNIKTNLLSGTLPSEWERSLPNLESLDLGDGDLVGTIPTQWGNLSFLQYLHVNGNHIDGAIPSEIGNLRMLYSLDLSWNLFSGSISPTIGFMTYLQFLGLDNNRLSGSVPSEIGNLYQLSALVLSYNPQLSGTIPTDLVAMKHLVEIGLRHTSITGPLDSIFCDGYPPTIVYADCEEIDCSCCDCGNT